MKEPVGAGLVAGVIADPVPLARCLLAPESGISAVGAGKKGTDEDAAVQRCRAGHVYCPPN
jgi:hypothetical protein